VLEAGCAEGHFTETLARRSSRVLALDISAVALERARRRAPRAVPVEADLMTWEPRDEAPFDAIVIGGGALLLGPPFRDPSSQFFLLGPDPLSFKDSCPVLWNGVCSGSQYRAPSAPKWRRFMADACARVSYRAVRNEQTRNFLQDCGVEGRIDVIPDVCIAASQAGAVRRRSGRPVIAIAAGICDGLSLGYNARAALITRGLAEMTRLAGKMGADPLTLSGLPGLGDLILTCTGELSRNRRVGIQIAQGKGLEEILSGMRMVAEGIKNTRSVYHLACRLGVEMPIVEQMYLVLYENKKAPDAVRDLMQRGLKPEMG